MIKKTLTIVLCGVITGAAFADDAVAEALHTAVNCQALSNRRAQGTISEYGLTARLRSAPEFTNLVSVLSEQYNTCPASSIYALSNRIERVVFVSALAQCGEDAYSSLVTRVFGGVTNGLPRNYEFYEDFIVPPHTQLESFIGLNYERPAINTFLNNVRGIASAEGNTNEVALVDVILSGEYKAERLKFISAGFEP